MPWPGQMVLVQQPRALLHCSPQASLQTLRALPACVPRGTALPLAPVTALRLGYFDICIPSTSR